jgi:hypothetical protein
MVDSTEQAAAAKEWAEAAAAEFDAQDYLAATWKFFPDEPVTIGGIPISCPGCGSAEGLRFWVHVGRDVVDAEHTCVPFTWDGPRSKVRLWPEPLISAADVKRHGTDMLTATDKMKLELREQLRALAAGRSK